MTTVTGLGIDLGSTTVKLALVEDGAVMRTEVRTASGNPLSVARCLLAGLTGFPIMATGYGRDLLEIHVECPVITEIKAHAAGAAFLVPGCTAVIDVGGQDLKVIALDPKGRVARFEMNDRCAAGTGKFLEVMAGRLGFSLNDFADMALQGHDTLSISAMCTVFAESEAVGLVNRGRPLPDIARALLKSVVRRISALFKRLDPPIGRVALTGGGARNPALVRLLEGELGLSLQVSPQSQCAGAIGCALLAAQQKPVILPTSHPTEAP